MIIKRGCEDSMKKIGSRSEFGRLGGGAVKAIALLSGGLDSTLAAALVHCLGIEVIGLNVCNLFGTDRKRSQHVATAAEAAGIPLRTLELSEEHLEVVRQPKHGYGAGMNPCVDCRIFMLKAAKRVMEEEGAQFVITGEVLGQRPMSQHFRALMLVAEESGLGNRLLRPLSANLLPDTLPVKKGWIRREDLLALRGRSRREQMALAACLGIHDYPQPAGGCLLLEKAYAARLRDAFSYIGREEMKKEDFHILRYGRQFRLSDRAKVIVGRNEPENEILSGFATGRVLIEPIDTVGPLTLVEGKPAHDEILLAASLAARYCDHDAEDTLPMRVIRAGRKSVVTVAPLAPNDPRISAWMIGGAKR